MASGLPVVASRATGGPDVGEDGKDVLIVPPANTPALAGALSRLAGDPALRETIGEAGARRVANEFSWNDYRRRVVEIFQARLARRS
jgi:glycosyltransferase involved in cell wall biosynthesis